MDNNIDPKVGEVWLVDLSNATGHQQRGIRPFVVTSNNKRNFFSPTIKGNPLSSRIYKRSPVQFSPPYGDGTTTPKYPVMDDAFPSPCGDKLKCYHRRPRLRHGSRFPSPCGDKLKCKRTYTAQRLIMFPSPCGDKLKFFMPCFV